MWNSFVDKDNNYLIRIDDDGKVSLTDFKCLWIQEIPKLEMINDFKQLNQDYVGDDDESFSEIMSCVRNVKFVESLVYEEDVCRLGIKAKTEDLPIRLHLILGKSEANSFFEEIMVPMVKTVQYLELKQNKYAEQLEKKDAEIQEYSIEFGTLKRKHLITEKFKRDPKTATEGLMINIFTKSDGFYEALTRNHGDIQEIYPELREKKVKIRKLVLPNFTRNKKMK